MVSYQVVHPSEIKYPQPLLNLRRPPRLYAIGNLSLLEEPCVGICGSRSASPTGLQHAETFGKTAARYGFVVISGYAAGVDSQAHRAAIEAGGATIAVLAEGVEHFRVRRELRSVADLDVNMLVLSPYEPEAIWASYRAMDRNRVIVGLASGLFVIEAKAKGGTYNAGVECLAQRKPLWVIDYERKGPDREGNDKLISASGIPIRTARDLETVLEQHVATLKRNHATQSRLALT
jgi:DNA processing protein